MGEVCASEVRKERARTLEELTRACKRKKQNEMFSVMGDGSGNPDWLFRSGVHSRLLGLDRNVAGQSGRTASDGETGSPDIAREEHCEGHGPVPVAHRSWGESGSTAIFKRIQ